MRIKNNESTGLHRYETKTGQERVKFTVDIPVSALVNDALAGVAIGILEEKQFTGIHELRTYLFSAIIKAEGADELKKKLVQQNQRWREEHNL